MAAPVPNHLQWNHQVPAGTTQVPLTIGHLFIPDFLVPSTENNHTLWISVDKALASGEFSEYELDGTRYHDIFYCKVQLLSQDRVPADKTLVAVMAAYNRHHSEITPNDMAEGKRVYDACQIQILQLTSTIQAQRIELEWEQERRDRAARS